MKISIHTLAEKLDEKSSFQDVLTAIEDLKKYIQCWHRQDEDDIYDAIDDWGGVYFACIMKDGSRRFASGTPDEAPSGMVSTYLDFLDLPDEKDYDSDDIDMWCILPWDPNMYMSGVELDGKLIQKGLQVDDKFRKPLSNSSTTQKG